MTPEQLIRLWLVLLDARPSPGVDPKGAEFDQTILNILHTAIKG